MEFKVALVGPKAAGKTTFLKRLQTGKFDEEYKPTIGYQDHNLYFNSNIGEIRFSVRDCGFETLSFVRDVDGVIVMDDISIENKYYNNTKNFHNNIPIINCHNDKSGNRVCGYDGRTCFISVKNDRNTLARPFLQLLRLLKGDDSINFIDKIVDVEEYDINLKLYREKKHNFIVTPIEKGIVNVVGKLNSDKKIVDLTEDEIIIAKNIGFVPIIHENKNKEFDYLLNLEHFSTGVNSTSPHKSYRIGYSGGMFEVICDFFKNGEIVEQKSVQSPNKTYWASVEDGIIRISYSFYMLKGVYEQTD